MAKARRHEVHRHHHQAPRRLRLFDSKLTDFDVMVDAVPARHHEGAGRGLPARRASGSAGTTRSWTGTIPTTCRGATWEKDRPRDGRRLRPLRRVPEGAAQGTADQLRPDRRPLVRRRVGSDLERTSAARDLYDYVRALQPDIIINNRVGKGRRAMAGSPRQRARRATSARPSRRSRPPACPASTGKPA